jgi:hypothetical protein
MATTTDPRQKLIDQGLLPNPATTGWTYATVRDEKCPDPRVHLHERSLGVLAGDYQRLFDRYTAQIDRLAKAEKTTLQRAHALQWLADNYDLDELAVEVIAHALAKVEAEF